MSIIVTVGVPGVWLLSLSRYDCILFTTLDLTHSAMGLQDSCVKTKLLSIPTF